ncbi:MAG: signal peptidase I [Candidatus Faecivicinus sp.]
MEINEKILDPEQQDPENGRKKKKKKKARKSFWGEVREWAVSLLVAVVVVLFLQNFVFTLIRVDGESMMTTLLDGERLFVTVADVKFGSISRDDVVICHYPNRGNTFFVKRAVGIPGDTVYRREGVTHIVYETTDENGQTVTVDNALDDAFVLYYNPANDYDPYVLGEDEYFVVGDNRGNSHDSRDWNDSDSSNDVGPITKDMITGHVRYVIWPLSDIRAVE